MKKKKTNRFYQMLFLLSMSSALLPGINVLADEAKTESNSDLSLSDILNLKVDTASKRKESLSEAPGVVSVITSKEIELFGANNLTELLSRVVGVLPSLSIFTNNNSLPIRGDVPRVNDTHVLILMNGNPINRDSYGGYLNEAIYASFPLMAIDHIEVVRGPGSVLYGTNAYSGVINLITKQDSKSKLEASAKYGTFYTTQVQGYGNYASESGDFKLNTSVNYIDTQGWPYSANATTYKTSPTSANQVNYNNYQHGDLGVNLNTEYKNLTLNALYVSTDMYSWRRASAPLGQSDLANQKIFADLGYKLSLGGDWNFSAHLADVATNNDLTPIVGAPSGLNTPLNYSINDSRLEMTVNGTLLSDLNLVMGGVVNRMSGVFSGNVWTQYWLSAYAQMDYRVMSWLKVIGGAQFNQVPDIQASLVPRLGAIVNFSPESGLKALYGQAFRAPFAGETTVAVPGSIIGNPSVTPETITTFDFQLFYNLPNYQYSLTYYQSHQSNLLLRTANTGANKATYPNTYANNGDFYSQGIEFETKVIPSNQFYGSGSFSLQTNDDGVGFSNISTAPIFVTKVGVGYTGSLFSAAVFDSLISPYVNSDAASIYRTPVVVNPATDWAQLLTANLKFDVKNIFNLGHSFPDTKVAIYGTNLLDQTINVTDFASTTAVNTIPGGPGRAVYGSVEIKL